MSLFAIGGAAAFTVSTIQLRNKFSGAAQSIPGLNTEYIAKYDSGFQNLARFLLHVIRASQDVM